MMNANEFLSLGKEAIQKGQFQLAEKCFHDAVSSDPEFVDAKVELSRIIAARGNLKQAEVLADEALQRSPNNALGLALKGIYLNARDEYRAGARWLEKAIQADPKLDVAYVNLGISQRVLGKWDESEKNLRKAIELNPRNHEAYYCLGFTLCLEKKIEEGILATLESIKINPLFVQGYLALGELYAKGGKGNLAAKLYKEALRHVPQAVPIRERLHAIGKS
jgi:tetratricopeptide (TPR) repeat protein